MDKLPTEMIEHILSVGGLSLKDLINIGATCRHLRNILQSSQVWSNFYHNNWPEYVSHIHGDEIDWLEEVKHVYDVQGAIREMLQEMPSRFFSIEDVGPSELTMWERFVDKDSPQTYHIATGYLSFLIRDYTAIASFQVVPLFTPGNKTLRYYCMKALQFLRQFKLTQDYAVFMQCDESERTLEKVATFVAQWCQPFITVEYADIQGKLDSLANMAKTELMRVNPNHPIFSVSPEVLNEWRTRNLNEHQFNVDRCEEILKAINVCLYEQCRFAENRTEFYDPRNSFMNYVLRRCVGLPITLCIVYESVARRLGVNCEPVNNPSHFLLRYKRVGISGMSRSLYVNASNNGTMFLRGVCPYSGASSQGGVKRDELPRANALDVLLRMSANLENAIQTAPQLAINLTTMRSVLELSVLAAPSNYNFVLNLARLCMSIKMGTDYIRDIISQTDYHDYGDQQGIANLLHMLNDYERHRQHVHVLEQPKPKRRPANEAIKYGVGMVMQHKLFRYVGVITDWTPVCNASREWQNCMNVDSLKRKGKQPFYYVYADDGSNRYVAEDNIVISSNPGSLLTMHELGRQFSHFHVNHFVPNAEMAKAYPEDESIRQKHIEN